MKPAQPRFLDAGPDLTIGQAGECQHARMGQQGRRRRQRIAPDRVFKSEGRNVCAGRRNCGTFPACPDDMEDDAVVGTVAVVPVPVPCLTLDMKLDVSLDEAVTLGENRPLVVGTAGVGWNAAEHDSDAELGKPGRVERLSLPDGGYRTLIQVGRGQERQDSHAIIAPVEHDSTVVERLRQKIREVPDFPSAGILFYDITTALKDPEGLEDAIALMAAPFADRSVELVVAMESRGFIFGAPIALQLHAGFAPVRKLGKLPAHTITREYELEYASNTLEIHRDAIEPGQRVLLVDDLLATGGTVAASIDMVQELGGIPVGVAVLVELPALGGRARLEPYGIDVVSFIRYA